MPAFTSTELRNLATGLIDFAVVFLIIYRLLLLIRGTRAVQVMTGLLVIVFGYFLSSDDYLGLPTLHWLLDKFFGAIVLVAVVLFQNDIRRAFSRVVETKWLGGRSQRTALGWVEELLKAVSMLRDARIGGLVVMERDADLSPLAESGTTLDAAVSKEVLFAIFNPGHASPLHDGACIIRGGRVAAAACFLPLTTNAEVDRTMGTRHRAAIGVTEELDAIALVVSESTQRITVAVGGHLSRDLSMPELRQLLVALLNRPPGGADPELPSDETLQRQPLAEVP
jgi:uncharacterized protein (TIGR00159 family)